MITINSGAYNAGVKTRAAIDNTLSTTARGTKHVVLSTSCFVTSFVAGWKAKPSMAVDNSRALVLVSRRA